MHYPNRFSRRQFLHAAGAAGCAVAMASIARAWAQGGPRIERIDFALGQILSSTRPVQAFGIGPG